VIKQIFLDSYFQDFNLEYGLPERSFPGKIDYRNEGNILTGYFANYDGLVEPDNLPGLFAGNNLSKLVNSNSDFLLFYLEKKKNRLRIVLDQSNSIPCFFSYLNGHLVVSTQFTKVTEEVKKNTKLNVNLDGLITWLLWEWHATEKTLFEEIKVIPPGCVVDIDLDNKKLKIESLVDLPGFLENTGELYTDEIAFAEDWEKTMLQVVADRAEKILDKKTTCDLSSGFDCTLVAYSLNKILGDRLVCNSKVSDVTREETDINIMNGFAQLHGIKLETVDTTKFDLFEADLSTAWNKNDPFQIAVTGFENYIRILEGKNVKVQFTGEGGDESYSASEMDLPETFPGQNSFFVNVMYFKKLGLERLFTKETVDFALGKDRFNSRAEYPMIVPISSAIPTENTFWRVWEKDIWMMNPFFDTRLIAFARRMPESIKGKKQDRKLTVLQNLPEVFPKEMFVKKYGREAAFLGFAKKQKKLVLEILENSALAKMGVINKNKFLQMVESEKSDLDDPEFAIVFQTMMQLDWFLQKNLN